MYLNFYTLWRYASRPLLLIPITTLSYVIPLAEAIYKPNFSIYQLIHKTLV